MSNPCIEHIAALIRLPGIEGLPKRLAHLELVDREQVVILALRIKAASDEMAKELTRNRKRGEP